MQGHAGDVEDFGNALLLFEGGNGLVRVVKVELDVEVERREAEERKA